MSMRDYFWVLEKTSLPHTWEKRFETEDECLHELLSHICGECLKGFPVYALNENDEWETTGGHETPPDPNSMGDLLSTSCGCEFLVTMPSEYGDV